MGKTNLEMSKTNGLCWKCRVYFSSHQSAYILCYLLFYQPIGPAANVNKFNLIKWFAADSRKLHTNSSKFLNLVTKPNEGTILLTSLRHLVPYISNHSSDGLSEV